MQPNWTVMAAFDERVAARFDAAFVTGSPLSWIARNTSKPKRNWQIDAWVIQASTAWSDAHLDDQPDDVGAFLMEAFEDLIPAGLPRAFYADGASLALRDRRSAARGRRDSRRRVANHVVWRLVRGPRIEDAYLSGIEAAGLIPDH